ncbi:MAG: Gfo/Idh/MocA family oxidoreductase, partial [Anaerolineae bacterium]
MDIEAVVISTPPPTHFAIARDCLLNGLHVLVEKPLAINSDEVRQLIQIAEENGRTLMVGHTFEYNPAVHALKEMIKSGELGDIHYIDAVRVSLGLFHPTLNVIWDLAPHDISILIHLLGEAPYSVSTKGVSCVQKDVEDIAYLTLMFPNNVLSHIRVSWLDPCKTRRITVVGSKKMVVYDDVESQEKIKVYDKRVNTIRRTDTFGEFQFAYHYGSIVSPYIRFEEPLRLECLLFAECIREGKRP